MKKSQGIRAAISAINTYGILVVPGLVDQRTAAGCAANADAALGESLLSCDGSSPCRYAVQLGLTHATRAAVLAVRGSAPMASALAAQLGDDAALCELSCEMSDGGAPIKPMHCATPACVEDAQTHYQEALAQRGASVLTVLIALCDVGYRAGAPLVWPRSHAAAVHADVRTRGADALRDGVGVHFDLRCGDAVLLDSRLWRCGGAHAPGLRRTALLAISFCTSASARCTPISSSNAFVATCFSATSTNRCVKSTLSSATSADVLRSVDRPTSKRSIILITLERFWSSKYL